MDRPLLQGVEGARVGRRNRHDGVEEAPYPGVPWHGLGRQLRVVEEDLDDPVRDGLARRHVVVERGDVYVELRRDAAQRDRVRAFPVGDRDGGPQDPLPGQWRHGSP